MKYLRKFDSVSDMETAIASAEVDFIGLAYNNGTPELNITVAVPPDPKAIPFYIEDVSGSENTVQITKGHNNAPTLTIEKSTDGTTWETMGTTSTTAITATVPANGKLYLRCSATTWSNSTYRNSIITTGNSNVGGNVMSLVYGSDFTGNETTFPSGSTYTFYGLFMPSTTNTKLINASQLILPATTLAESCYYAMFSGCTSLTTVPTLPATTLVQYCYSSMFDGCTSLTTAPALPATTLAQNCYWSMFQGCTALTTAPALPVTTLVQSCYQNMFKLCSSLTSAPALPATTLAKSCYMDMFNGCTSLTTAPAILPATTLDNQCYRNMFTGCTALTTAPELPATTLAQQCYQGMLSNCTSLTYIKCLATDISASKCTDYWVQNVAATGTFVKDRSMSTSNWGTGNNGIPEGWTVQDAAE